MVFFPRSRADRFLQLPFFRLGTLAASSLASIVRLAPGGKSEPVGGFVLVVVGLVIAAWGVYGFKTQDKIVDIGPIHAKKTTEHHIPCASIVGGLVLVGDVAKIVMARTLANRVLI
jgi:hypothetical protein